MKTPCIAILMALAVPSIHAENLTQADKEALLEKLEKIHAEATTRVDARFKAALSAYSSAMSSDDAAIDLYLKCEEMVNFDEMKRKSGDFRDWKRQQTERLSDKDFKMALRQQLRWLVLTLQAASKDPDRDQLAAEAGKILDSIVSQAEDLSAHRGVLEQGVLGSVYARAYDINGVKIDKWPFSPIQIKEIYDQIIFPPLRRADRLDSLKAAWSKRMVQESTLLDLWSGKPGEKNKTGERSPQYDKFVSDTLPKLQWESEVDLFKSGDQRDAALRMLAHIEKYIAHEAASQWAADFTALLQPKPTVEDEDPAVDAINP